MYTVKYLVRRVLVYILTLFMAIVINFVVPRLIPGNPIEAKLIQLYRLGVNMGGAEFVMKYSKLFALDQPMHVQFLIYLSNLVQGNLGFSISYFPTPVWQIIMIALPWTLGLLSVAVVIAFAGGLILGALMGWTKREGKQSRITSLVFSVFVVSSQIPYYMLGMIFVYLLTYVMALFPYGGGVQIGLTWGTLDYIISIIQHATLPALSIVLVQLGGWGLEARSLMVNVLGEDYLFLAKAKGLRERFIFREYAMRNTVVPIVTDLVISLGTIASGSIMTEIIFSYPGVGSLLFNAVKQLDYPIIQGVSLIIIFAVTTAALLIDLIYPLLDPRIGEK